jgi:guanosine-3',5'-bis(diphosphate) 3'-pyrophosphohydrolase
MDLYQRALKIAIEAHKGQIRKHDGSAYVAHPIMVARILERAGFSEVVVAAGLTHDVLEDTLITESELRVLLGDAVVDIVAAVSEDQTLAWEERKEKYVSTVVTGGESVWAVSVADKIHNAQDFIAFHAMAGPSCWSVFNRDKEKKIWFEKLVHTELSKVWKHPLLDTYATLITTLESLAD